MSDSFVNDSFANVSYLAQVRRLRRLAIEAIGTYSIKVGKLDFINHGENATFCVRAKNGRKYLLRILRGGYHTHQAVEAELRWLRHLAEKGFAVPNPVPARNGKLSNWIACPSLPSGRRCCLFEWVEGRFIVNSLNENHMYQVGGLLARLQQEVPVGVAQHRRYWTAEGLVGRKPKFGRTDRLLDVSARDQRIISKARSVVFSKLKRFERRFPKRLGMIHADLHFRNLLVSDGRVAAIDFDDAGYGFYVYDLVIPLQSAENHLGPKRKKELPKLRAALIKGYSEVAPWDDEDEKMIDHMLAARRISMLGWMNSRSENARLRKYLKKSAKNVAQRLKRAYL